MNTATIDPTVNALLDVAALTLKFSRVPRASIDVVLKYLRALRRWAVTEGLAQPTAEALPCAP